MKEVDIAVVGGGNGSYTIAGDLALAGHRVRMWPGSRERHAELYDRRAIGVTGMGRQGEGKLDLVADEAAGAVRGAEIVFCSDPAHTQEERSRILAPLLEDGQVVFLSPGSMGSVLFGRSVWDFGCQTGVTFVEPGTLPYLTRKVAPTEVQVSGLAVRLPVGAFPSRNTARAMGLVDRVYPAAHAVENALSAALLNVGPIIHSVLILLNTGPIEHFPHWDIHNEGTTASVKKLILAHDQERIALRKALGFTSHHYPFADHYEPVGDAEWMYGRRGHTELVKSEKWREKVGYSHRYVVEDVQCNLALQASVGDLCQVETPIMDSVLTLIGAIAGEEYRKTGRTLESLGLGDLSLAEIDEFLERGFGDRPTES